MFIPNHSILDENILKEKVVITLRFVVEIQLF